MPARTPVLLAALLLPACSTEPAAPTPAEAASPAPTPQAAETSTAEQPAAIPATTSGGLPDLSQNLESGSCGNGPGNEGADSHFLGEFTITGSTVSGTERWLLAANSKLQASPLWGAGESCEVRWMLAGTVVPPLHCGDCDLGLQLTANVDLTGSTCPEDMVKREKTFQVRYDVRRAADGVAWVYFANSGKLLGQGYHQGERFNYLTQHQCKWF